MSLLTPSVSIAIFLTLALVSGLVNAHGRGRRMVGAIIGCSGLALPFLTDLHPVGIFILALPCLVLGIRSWDLLWESQHLPAQQRIWHLVALFDTRLSRRIDPGLDPALLRRILVWLPIGALGIGICLAGGQLDSPLGYLLRYGGFVPFALATVEVLTAWLRLCYALLGHSPPIMHSKPHLSTTVREFWGRRWNRVVGRWLRRYCYLPLARRGHPGLGMARAFAVSALMHIYLVLAALGLGWSLVFGLFFVLQIAVMLAEQKLGVARWPRPAARVWTWSVMVVASPLFSEPLIRMFENFVGLAPL